MEADWEVEIGPDASVIDGAWPGMVDLERYPHRVAEIKEACDFKPIADALLLLNAPVQATGQTSVDETCHLPLVRTTKCDLWAVTDLDPDEMEASPATCLFGMAAYIDMLPRKSKVFPDLLAAEEWAHQTVANLRNIPTSAARVDLVLRQAITADCEGLGITAYITGCGQTQAEAYTSLGRALQHLSETVAGLRNQRSQTIG